MFLRTAVLCLVVACLAALAAPTQTHGQGAGVEVLTRGPLHEAFAETVTFAAEPGMIVKKAPPEAIEELPPEQKPDGENVTWIPGYFAWDDEREDFLWVSGVWRALPPDRQWIAGYWAKAAGGHQWISGYWADAGATEVRYFSDLPKTLDTGPNVAAPSAEHVWIPGVWVWHDGDYAWRPGYWMVPKANWIWVPSHWVWTPGGNVFVDGYWDYSIPRRGVVFAPVFFAQRIYTQPNYYYSPTVVINPVVFVSHIFCRPTYGHYYFGDYYAANYVNLGIYPSFSYQYRNGFDPLFAYQTWQHREDRAWLTSVKQTYTRLQQDEAARPPRTFIAARGSANTDVSNAVAITLDQVVKNNFTTLRFQAMPQAERQQLARSAQEFQQVRKDRQELELKNAVRTDAKTAPAAAKGQPVAHKVPRSPIAYKNADSRVEERGANREAVGTDKTGRRETLKPPLDDRGQPRGPLDRATAEPRPRPGDRTPPTPAPAPGRDRTKVPEVPKDPDRSKPAPTDRDILPEPGSDRTPPPPKADGGPLDRPAAGSPKGKAPMPPRPERDLDSDPVREPGKTRPDKESPPPKPEKPLPGAAKPAKTAPDDLQKGIKTPHPDLKPDSPKEASDRAKGSPPKTNPERGKPENPTKKRPDDKSKSKTKKEDEKKRPEDELPK